MGGSAPKAYSDVEQTRSRIIQEFEAIKSQLDSGGGGPTRSVGLARVKLREKALAKTHRPQDTFTPETCPIIGDCNGPGEILVLVSPERVDNLNRKIRGFGAKRATLLTSIESISLIEIERRFPSTAQVRVRDELARRGNVTLKVRVPNFTLFSALDRAELEQAFLNLFGVEGHPYFDFGLFSLYAATVRTMEQALAIARLQFIERLELMPVYTAVGTGIIDVASLRLANDIPFDDLPIVGIVDTGIERGSPLEPLVWQHESLVPPAYYNPKHGTAVAALVADKRGLRSNVVVPRARLFDLAVLADSPSYSGIDETRLIRYLEDALDTYSSDVRLWNMSMAEATSDRPTEFSDIAKALDNLQKRYDVQFFSAAGNCEGQNLRTQWPPDLTRAVRDWVAAPGDALCSVTVGSHAPADSPSDAAVPSCAPSPFSPHGPVAHNAEKPNILADGGSFDRDGQPFGVKTILPNGDPCTDQVGTSFSTPQASGAGAELLACFSMSNLAPRHQLLLAKALMLHRAELPAVFSLAGDFRLSDYYGLGMLVAAEKMLDDAFWRSTSLIVAHLYPDGRELVIDDFPYPDVLHASDHYKGRLLVTMVSDPVLDPNFRVEYARSNVEVHFGVMQKQRDGKLRLKSQATSTRAATGFEKDLIREEHKWSPIKQYRSVSELWCPGEQWRLSARLTLRDQESERVKANPDLIPTYGVDVVIAVTVEDPDMRVPINDEMAVKWRTRGFIAETVPVAPRIRLSWE